MTRWLLLCAALAAACTDYSSTEASGPCQDLCTELADNCEYAAFPSFDSCLQGCAYEQTELGADIEGELACVQEAECDTFAILECEHAYGGDGDESGLDTGDDDA